MKHVLRCLLILVVAVGTAHASTLLTESFDDITTLPGTGWVMANNSNPVGTTGWFQGNSGVFAAQAGAPDAYIAANFLNADFGGNISNWLLLPMLTLNNGDSITFYTRTEDPAVFADRLEVRLSLNGLSADVGATDTSVGDFTTLLHSINPTLDPTGYPASWTSFTAFVTGLAGPTDGRLAFRYFVPDTSANGDYIGIDTVSVNTATTPVPLPSTFTLLGFGVTALSFLRLRVACRK